MNKNFLIKKFFQNSLKNLKSKNIFYRYNKKSYSYKDLNSFYIRFLNHISNFSNSRKKIATIAEKNFEMYSSIISIILSKNIPFVKFKDKSEQIVHKFFKPVFQRKQKKYRTIINKNELYNWIKYSSIKFDNNEVIYKTNMTKVLLYKLLFFELKGKRKLKGKLYSFDLNDNKFEIESKNKMIYVVEKDYIHNFNEFKKIIKK